MASAAPGPSVRATLFDDTLPQVSGVHRLPTAGSDPFTHVGRRCGHFEITDLIGQGGMGTVYAAWDGALHRRVALKVLPDTVDERSEAHERFLEEARAQARLSSPHVVHVYYVGRTRLSRGDKVSAFFAMELVEGGTLEDVLARGETLEPARARELMVGVALGLRDALAAGIVHRDIKPSNLLLDAAGQVRIADFGVARHLHAERELRLTLSGRMVGTPLYMAPEQARGEPADHRADMYSLGCTFYHLLAGEPPFPGRTVGEIVAKHLSAEPAPLSEVAPHVPSGLSAVIERLLDKDPARRFESYEALLAALEALDRRARVAGVPARAAACAVDVGVVIGIAWVFGWAGLLLHLAAVTLAHARFGQTLGKWLMHIEVRTTSGARLGLLRSLARTLTSLWLPLVLAAMVFVTTGSQSFDLALAFVRARDLGGLGHMLLSFFWAGGVLSVVYLAGLAVALLDPARRAAHDRLVSSEVVYRLP